MQTKQTDNGNLKSKLTLRRYFLDKYHPEGSARVFDACQGSGTLWNELRKTHQVKSYFGVDQKPKSGRIKFDSARIISEIKADVYDIDTYGSPWKHYSELLRHLKHPATIFLTLGDLGLTAMNPAAHGCDILGLPSKTPPVLAGKIARIYSVSYWLTSSCDSGLLPIEIKESERGRCARYFGVRLDFPSQHDALPETSTAIVQPDRRPARRD